MQNFSIQKATVSTPIAHKLSGYKMSLYVKTSHTSQKKKVVLVCICALGPSSGPFPACLYCILSFRLLVNVSMNPNLI